MNIKGEKKTTQAFESERKHNYKIRIDTRYKIKT